MAKEGIKPTIIALVICDNIYTEPSGKTALVGLFNSVQASEFPHRHGRLAVFVSVTGLRSQAECKLEIVHGETDQVVVTAKGSFPEQVGPVDVVDMEFILGNLVFPESGTYYIRFWGNDHLLAMRPFSVRRIAKKGESE